MTVTSSAELQQAARAFASASPDEATTPPDEAVALESAALKLAADRIRETGEAGSLHAALLAESLVPGSEE